MCCPRGRSSFSSSKAGWARWRLDLVNSLAIVDALPNGARTHALDDDENAEERYHYPCVLKAMRISVRKVVLGHVSVLRDRIRGGRSVGVFFDRFTFLQIFIKSSKSSYTFVRFQCSSFVSEEQVSVVLAGLEVGFADLHRHQHFQCAETCPFICSTLEYARWYVAASLLKR